MSAFLGPIHHWMYDKILLQEDLTDRLLALAAEKGWVPDLSAQLEKTYGTVVRGPLESVIDTSNIHGWLSARVAAAEGRLSDGVRALLNGEAGRINDLTLLFETEGRARAVPPGTDAETAYRTLDSLLLDGMPCDGGRQVTAQDGGTIVWEYAQEVHPLCNDTAGCEAFSALREAFVRGVLEGAGFKLAPLGETVYRLERGA